jgi:hypothetical protein
MSQMGGHLGGDQPLPRHISGEDRVNRANITGAGIRSAGAHRMEPRAAGPGPKKTPPPLPPKPRGPGGPPKKPPPLPPKPKKTPPPLPPKPKKTPPPLPPKPKKPDVPTAPPAPEPPPASASGDSATTGSTTGGSAKETKKTQPGKSEARTVLQLEPVRYVMNLVYLNDTRIKHKKTDPNAYRCKFALHENTTAINDLVAEIPNIVGPNDKDEADDKAAKPAEKGGDYTAPKKDTMYRLLVTDNHGMRASETNLLGDDGDNESRVENYRKVDGDKPSWFPDVRPAVPFRVVVRRFTGRAPEDIIPGLKVVVEIKDPVEEFEKDDTNRKKFLQKFFDKYNREDKVPDPGDDNANNWFGPAKPDGNGMRTPSYKHPGVVATEVLKTMPYKDKPKLDKPEPLPQQLEFSELTDAAAHGAYNAEFALTEVEEERFGKKIKVGVADFVFYPYPASGDNFRFLLTLVNAAGKDVREDDGPDNNNSFATLEDNDQRPIAKPRAYTTGRIVLWRRTYIRLVVLVNNRTKADINWAEVQRIYRTAFYEVVPPSNASGYRTLTVAGWIEELKKFLTDPQETAVLNWIAAQPGPVQNNFYNAWFVPPQFWQESDPQTVPPDQKFGPLRTHGWLKARIKQTVTQSILKRTCAIDPKIDAPQDSPGQTDKQEGLFAVLIKAFHKEQTIAGSYLGDRMFILCTNSSAAVTNTTAHEMGHTFYLRHSNTTKRNDLYFTPHGGGAVKKLWMIDPTSNCQSEDHDQADAYDCLQSYTRALDATPCGVCALTLRFYDRVKLQSRERFGKQIMEGLGDVTIYPGKRANTPARKWHWDVRETAVVSGAAQLPDLKVDEEMDIVALGPEETFAAKGTKDKIGRTNMSCNGDTTKIWRQMPAGGTSGAVQIRAYPDGPDDSPNRIRLKGKHVGKVTIMYSNMGRTAQADIEIKPKP